MENNRIRINGQNYKYVKSREIQGQIKAVTVKRRYPGHFRFCFSVKEYSKPKSVMTGKTAGMDFGLKNFLTLDTGKIITSPLFFRQDMKRIAKLNQSLSGKEKGSNNRRKARLALSSAHRDVANKREDFQWKLALELVREYDELCVENLNLGTMKSRWGRKYLIWVSIRLCSNWTICVRWKGKHWHV